MDKIQETKETVKVIPATEMSKEELIAAYETLLKTTALASEDDIYSLTQPNPYRFVPSMLSSHSTQE